MTPDEYCKDKAASSGSSFYYSFLFLAPERRRAITALYAFCREVDDIVDETEDPQIAATSSRGGGTRSPTCLPASRSTRLRARSSRRSSPSASRRCG